MRISMELKTGIYNFTYKITNSCKNIVTHKNYRPQSICLGECILPNFLDKFWYCYPQELVTMLECLNAGKLNIYIYIKDTWEKVLWANKTNYMYAVNIHCHPFLLVHSPLQILPFLDLYQRMLLYQFFW